MMRYFAECLFNSEQTRNSGSVSATARSPKSWIQLCAPPFFVERAGRRFKDKTARPLIRIQALHLLPKLERTPMILRRSSHRCIFAHNFYRIIHTAASDLFCESRPSIVNNQPPRQRSVTGVFYFLIFIFERL